MPKNCPKCGSEVSDDFAFCPSCGAELTEVSTEEMAEKNLFRSEKGKYSWVYELNMFKSFFLLFEVWKVIAMAAAVVAIFMMLVALFEGSGLEGALFSIELGALCMGIILVLSLPAYYIVTKANNGKYTVLFEMDEDGVDHTQIKTDKAKALDVLTVAVGIANKSLTTAGAGMLSASGGSLYSKFSNVRKIKGERSRNLIRVNGRLIHNMVYVDDENYDFVYNFIVNHCPGARIV